MPGLEKYREGVKKAFNAMLFGYARDRFPVGMRGLFPKRFKITDVTGAILQRHPALKRVFGNAESGFRLMFLESEIMMSVLRSCRERGIVALPVYDCVVVRGSAAPAAQDIMRAAFKNVAGFDGVVRWEGVSAADL